VPKKQVFISHSRKDGSAAASILRVFLEKEGIGVLLDEEDFAPNEDLKMAMARAVEETEVTVCVLSPGYFAHPENTMYELERAARANKCWSVLSNISFADVKVALGLDIHGIAGNLLPILNPYDPQPTVAKIVKHLDSKMATKVVKDPDSEGAQGIEAIAGEVATTITYDRPAPEPVESVEQFVVIGSDEVSEWLTTSVANPIAVTKRSTSVVSISRDLFSSGDVLVTANLMVDAEVYCVPGSVAQLWAEVTYGGTNRRFALKRIRCETTLFVAEPEPIDFISIGLETLRIDPSQSGSRYLRNSALISEFQIGVDLIQGDGPLSIHVKSATLRVCVSGLFVLKRRTRLSPKDSSTS
jgi:hypothetical protein